MISESTYNFINTILPFMTGIWTGAILVIAYSLVTIASKRK